jgi:intracellular sulfur oxidation DsrE/DsrF family protein
MPGQDAGLTRDISVIFDGSTNQGEAIAIIVRFLDNKWIITQRLVRIDVCSKSVNADKLAKVLNQCLAVDYGVQASSLLAAMRNGASVN